MSNGNHKAHPSWKTRAVFAILAAVAVISYFERPAPGAGVSVPQREFFLPQFGHGGNPSGLNFSSVITLINLSTTTSQVSVLALSPEGGTIPLLRDPNTGNAVPSLSSQIPANGTAQIFSLNQDPDRIQTGTVTIFSVNDRVVTQTEFSIRTGSRLEARAQVPGRPLRQRGSFPVGEQGQTGVAILNPFINDMPADVRLATVDASGHAIDTSSMDLMPGQQISRFLDQLMDVNGATSVEFYSSIPVAILPLQQDRLVLTTQDLFPGRNIVSLFSNGN